MTNDRERPKLILNGRDIGGRRYIKYREIIMEAVGGPGKLPRPIPHPLDDYWNQWTVTFSKAKFVYAGPEIIKCEQGILLPGQDLELTHETIINVIKTDNS